MKSIFKYIFIIYTGIAYCQSNVYDEKINMQVIGPSPTNAALIIHDKIPVNENSGIPDISIPLTTVKTIDNHISIDLTLKYHPYQIVAETVAGNNGLAWSLNPGGVVTRTMRGIPDEKRNRNDEFGILIAHNSPGQIYYSRFDNDDKIRNNVNSAREYFFNSYKGKIDNEYDIFNLQAFGVSEEFHLINVNNTLKVKKLTQSNNIIDIIYTYSNYIYDIQGFILTDTNGTKFYFTEVETSLTKGLTFINTNVNTNIDQEYKSAFKLSQVVNSNNVVLANYNYAEDTENKSKYTSINNIYDKDIYDQRFRWSNTTLPPLKSENVTNITSKVKNIKSIIIQNIGEILFDYTNNRQDQNLGVAKSLSKITVKNNQQKIINNIEFDYTYSINTNRLLLKAIKNNDLDYSIEYNSIGNNIYKLYTDSWGFYTKSDKKKSDENFAQIDLIKNIIYPTKKVVNLVFELNDFSYVKNLKLSNDIILEYNEKDENETIIVSGYTTTYVQNSFNNIFHFNPIITRNNNNYVLKKFRYIPTKESSTGMLFFNEDGKLIGRDFNGFYTFNEGKEYTATFRQTEVDKGKYDDLTFYLDLHYELVKNTTNNKEFVKGAGIRIKKITDGDLITEYIYRQNDKVSHGVYNNFLPTYKYSQAQNHLAATPSGLSTLYELFTIHTDIVTTNDNIETIFYNGSLVNYKTVTTKNNNGYFIKNYSTSFNSTDSPISSYKSNYPFISITKKDYDKGLLLSEYIFNQNNEIVKKTYYNYELVNTETYKIGNRFYSHHTDPFLNYFEKFEGYINHTTQGDIKNNIYHIDVNFYTGKANLSSKTTTEYFNDKKIETTNQYKYNTKNQLISESLIQNNNEISKTDYIYDNNNTNQFTSNIIDNVSNIINYKNNSVSSKTITYTNSSTNQTYLPNTLSVSKVGGEQHIKAKYNRYDNFGNVEETQSMDNGLITSYIYGYNKTLPVVKLENVAYSSIDSNIIQQIQDTTTEDVLIRLFKNLRENHPQGFVTGYIHIPLVGISKTVDQNGKETKYEYDTQNRLIQIIDDEKNIINQYQYNYKSL